MKKHVFRFIFLLAGLFIQSVEAQVTPNINSGNPQFPFPQFLDYGSDRKSLASHNAPGMTHVEMEYRMQQAYNMMCNAMSYTGDQAGGVKYIIQNAKLLSPGGDPCSCAEADGYYMLAAAYMGDKTTYDGLYMQMHDRAVRRVKRFIDGVVNAPDWGYSKGGNGAGNKTSPTGSLGTSANWGEGAATDGDEDIALAMLVAYKQWGEKSGIILNGNGWVNHEINYKEEARFFIGAMADTVFATHKAGDLPHGRKYYNTGLIGLDGYIKDGDKQSDLTDWFKNGISNYKGIQYYDKVGPANTGYVDYHSPAYMHQFAKWFEKEGYSDWCTNQFWRAAASSDWLIGYHYAKSPKSIPYAGFVNVVPNSNNLDFTFTDMNPGGEDFRYAWRTITNYMWHGNPSYTWDPVTHEIVKNKPNTYERDMGIRYAKFLMNQQGAPWNNPCRNIGDLKPRLTFKGTYTIVNGYLSDGTVQGSFPIPQTLGSGSSSAVAAQDFELMGEIFRHCASVWDGTPRTATNQTATYFHEWFKLLGLLTVSGNFHAPDNMIARPNLKVYHKIDKTFGFTGDQMTYTISYRNYGSMDATGSVVKFGIPPGFEFVSSNKGTLSGDSVVWNVGAIKGFKSGSLGGIDSMKVTVKVGPTASGRYCTSARVFCANGLGWTSDEYPNNKTTVMERNCVDIVKRALRIEKTASRKQVNPVSNPDVVYKIKFENSSDAGWINGGRPGVRLAFAHENLTTPKSDADNVLKFRLFHDAAEPYIDYGNYRVSYFMNDNNIKGYSTASGGATWGLENSFAEGVDKDLVKVTHEQITPGVDANGSWNQRIVLQFSPQVATITQHLQHYAGSPDKVHEGGTAALRGAWRMYTNNYTPVDWTDDWSWDPTQHDVDDGLFYPISDDYSDPNNLGLPINSWHRSACQTSSNIVKRVLVEEWDGYVWRRIMGNGPLPGRDIPDVIITDTLPAGISFKNFIRQTALGITATSTPLSGGRTLIKWSIPKMQVNQKDSLIYTVTVANSCPGTDKLLINKAWIEGSSESAISESDTITVTCNPVTICPETTTLLKSSDKTTYVLNDPVTYTLKYTQSQGSIANPDLSTSTDWTAQSGSMTNATFGSGKASIGQINGGDLVLTHDYSYGTNTLGEGIEGTIQISSYSKAAIVVRHGGGSYNNGVFVVIKPAYPSTVDVYNGTTLVGSGTFPDQTPPSVDFRIKLTGNKLELWIGPTPTVFSGAPSMSFTGITVQPGWVGFSRGTTIGDPSGTGTISSWRTHMDAAFNVVITDPIPTGIITPSAISNSGTNNAGVITWNLAVAKTPMLYGAKQDLTWKGVFNTCQKVTNVAYVNTRGITGNQLGVCYDINCGTIPVCSFTTATLTPSGSTTFCKGKNVTFTATTNGTTNVRYQLYKGNVALGTPQTSTTFIVDSSGSYKVRAFDNLNTTCFAESPVVVVTANPVPVATLTSGATSYCNAPSGITLTAADAGIGATYQFQNGTVVGTASTTRTLANALAGSWTVIVKSSQGCSDTSVATIITANPKPTAAFTRNPTINPVTIGTLVNFTNASTGANTYQWKIDGVAFETATNSTYTFDKSGAFKIRLIAINTAGCKDSIEATINIDLAPTCKAPTNLLPLNALVTRCVGDTANLKTSYTLNATPLNGYRFVWYKKGEIIPSYTANTSYVPKAFTNLAETDAGDWTLRIEDGSVGSATCLAETTVKLVVNPIPVADILPKNPQYCGSTGASISASPNGNGETYEWFKDNLPFGTASISNVLSNALAGSYTVQVVSNGCKSVVSSASVVSQTTAIVPKVEISTDKPTSCAGEMITFTANPTNATSYEWFVNSQKQTSTSATFSSASLSNNDTVKVILTTDEACANPKIAQDTILAKVLPVVVPTVVLKPVSPKVCLSEVVTFEIESSTNAGTPTYTWMVDDVQAATGATFPKTITAKTNVYAVMKTTLACAEPKEVKSEVQVVDLEENQIPSVEITANKTTVCEDAKIIEFSITARSGTGDKPLYQWLVNGEPILGKTNDSAFFNNLKNGDKVSLRMTSNAACRIKDEAISNEINITIVSKPDSKILNTLLSYCTGSTGISLQARDLAGATYEWFKGTASVGTGITLPNATVGNYALKTSIGTCSATSDSVKVTQKALPIAEINPDNLVYCQGATGATLTAKPVAGATYEWLKETVPQGSASTNNQYTSALKGLYSVKVTLDGCDSTSSEVLVTEVGSISANVKLSATETTVCQGGTATVSIESQSDGTIEWFVDNVSKGNTSPLVFQPTANAKVLAIITTTASCASPKVAKDSVEITVTAAATAELNITLDKVGGLACEGDTAYVSATSNVGTVTWSNGTIGNKATFVNWKNGDKIAANLSNTLACVNPKLINKELTLNGILRAPFDFTLNVVSNSESVICKNSELNLAAITNTAGLTYAWKNAQETGTDSTFKPGTTTTVRGTVTASKTGCFSSGNRISKEEEFIYILAEKIGLAFSQPPSSICENTMSFFTIVPTSGSDNIQQYVWFKNDTLQNGWTENKADFTNLKNGDVLKVKAIPKTVCSAEIPDSATFRVQVDKQPKPGFVHEKEGDILYFCKDDSTLRANETADYQYMWLEAPANSTDSLKVNKKGTYRLLIKNGACVTDTLRAVVKDYKLSLEILVEPAAEFEVGEELKLTANVSNPEQRNLTYAWSPANLFRPANAAITSMSPTETMFVNVEVKSPENCILKDSIQLKKRDKLFIPNALTPETGDQNAVWGITGSENYPDMEIKVFNRWGTLVHEQKGYTKQWDGTLNGKPLPAGTYYYVMKHRTLDKPRVGDLTIVR